eukprot:2190360-Rhodomonas_salina.2
MIFLKGYLRLATAFQPHSNSLLNSTTYQVRESRAEHTVSAIEQESSETQRCRYTTGRGRIDCDEEGRGNAP